MDWFTKNTNRISDKIGISNDVSVLAAISKNEGPEFYRVIAGITKWEPGHLEGEILGEEPWNTTHCWSYTTATVETIFNFEDIDQWHKVISEASLLQVNNWF